MHPWDKSRQTIRFNMARPADAPYWANTVDLGTVKASGTHFFLAVADGSASGLSQEFTLDTSMVAQHKTDGTIPTSVSTAVLRPLHSDMEFPYEERVSVAVADYALTTLAHSLGVPTQHRIHVERMDSQSWTLLLDDLSNVDEAPKRVDSTIGPAGSDISVISTAVAAYRQCPYVLDMHNADPEGVTDELPRKKPKRFSFTKLFH